MTCLAFFDISHDAGFARMRAAGDFALRAVLQFSIDMGFHQKPPESPALYSDISAAKLARGCPLEAWLSNLVHEEGGYGFEQAECLVNTDARLSHGDMMVDL